MAIKINLNTTVIPVEIGTHKFEVNMTDEKELAFQETLGEFSKKAQTLGEYGEKDVEKLRGMVLEMIDELLGEGSFDLLYRDVPNVGILLGVLVEVIQEISKVAKERVMPKSVEKIIAKKST